METRRLAVKNVAAGRKWYENDGSDTIEAVGESN